VQKLAQQEVPRLVTVSRPIAHHGYGSKTAFLSSLAFGLRKFFNLQISDDETQMLTRRGGTSGVGFYTFRAGGLVWDDGQPSNGIPVGPSSIQTPIGPPLLINRWESPPHGVLVVIPAVPPIEHKKEIEVMAQGVYDRVELRDLYSAVFKRFIPAYLSSDYAELRYALDDISTRGFKRIEISAQDERVGALRQYISTSLSLPCGMSSMGPLLYALYDRQSVDVDDIARHLSARNDVASTHLANTRNRGYEIAA
jgi:beta-ribofuranosylaminobenzene 5'-phosphate synthase